jgi:pectinesterase
VILSYNASSASAGGNVESATLRIESPNVSFYNVLVENTAGNAGPSHALSAGAPHLGFYGCGFTGYQDTVFVGKPGVVFKNSYLEGAVDFIYGTDANILFEKCDIGFSREKGGYITASGRDRADANWYVPFFHVTEPIPCHTRICY